MGDPASLTWNDVNNRVSTPSPDGKLVAVVLRRGNPEQGTNSAELLVYRTADLLDHPKPQVLAQFASATKYQPIALVHWLADNETVIFAGTQGEGYSQVYQASTRTGEVRPLTELHSQMAWFGITANGDWVATTSEPSLAPNSKDPACARRGCVVTADSLYDALSGTNGKSGPVTLHDVRRGVSRTFAPPEESDPELNIGVDDLRGGVSPDGRFALRICRFHPFHWPSWWADYSADSEQKRLLIGGQSRVYRQWILYDFERNTRVRLTDAPHSMRNYTGASPIWIDGGSRLILAGAFESLGEVDGNERSLRARHYAVLIIDPVTRRTERIARLDARVHHITSAKWDEQAETLSIQASEASGQPLPVASWQRSQGRWTETAASAPSGSGTVSPPRPQLSIKESLNDPPVLVATHPETGVTRTVLDPNPWLAERSLGRVEAITWKSKDGRTLRGGLYYPTNYTPGQRYPLVLQTHGFEDNVFSLFGVARNFAAQPLAGRGIMVLQVAENLRGVVGGPKELPTVRLGYESAIDHLDKLGLIDRSRVGIQGWSRTGPHIGHTMTHSDYNFAAGVFTITADFGWFYYVSQGGGALQGETIYGPAPFGEGFGAWMEMSPTFNLDRVRTPMLMVGGEVFGLWDWYAGLRSAKNAVEYWSLPDTTHDVFKADQRMLMNQLVVDWFCFWLNNEERTEPTGYAGDNTASLTDQYKRWRELRRQQEELLHRPRRPLLDWTATPITEPKR